MVRSAILLGTFFLVVVAAEPVVAARPEGKSQPSLAREMPPEFKQAGVCARCHVISVLEWGVSGHLDTEADCQKCHGPSREHVANERNEVKVDRFPHGAEIAKKTCLTCHEDGCPDTLELKSCQKCHHVHALINPSKPPSVKDDRLTKLLARWEPFRKTMAKGDRHVDRHEWKAAHEAFGAALELIPGNHRARMRLEMCSRRLNPGLPGFTIVGDRYDAETGLPREVTVAGLEMPMLLAPPGEFDMGSDDLAASRPVHTVRVGAFYLGRYEVTQAEWHSVMGANPSAHQGTGFPNAEQMPVERVSWNDCQEFLRRVNTRIAGGRFRLPTEAEWEYACRAGCSQPVEQGLAERAWFLANSLRQPKPDGPFLQVDAYAPRPVGTRQSNAWGFSDMQGNVSEWCSSLRRPYLYRAGDGRESLTQAGLRVLRGGGFADPAAVLDPALRHAERPHRRLRFNGLRLARSIPSLRFRQ